MKKNTLVVTHERSGTHLVINCINYKNNGDFIPIGKLAKNEIHTTENYINRVHRNIIYNLYDADVVFKSHHQVEFFEKYMDELFEKYKVIYVKRSIHDVLLSYYYFLNGKGWDANGKSMPIPDFPEFKDWIFMRPETVGYKYFEKYPDPHIFNEPYDYIDRYLLHYKGWQKYKNNILVVNYEDILNNYKTEKEKIETYLNQKIADKIPDLHDPILPNFAPNKGIVGSHKDMMDNELIKKIESRLNETLL